jgi:YVTN family beta-propeller protein
MGARSAQVRQSRLFAGVLTVALLVLGFAYLARPAPSTARALPASGGEPGGPAAGVGDPGGRTPAGPPGDLGAAPRPSSDGTRPVRLDRITGKLTPKSVVASTAGVVITNNMMYSHNATLFNAEGQLLGSIDDSVTLADFGIPGHPGKVKGAPVEAAFTPSGAHVYVSNYSMYGEGFGPEGQDSCTPASGTHRSYLYRIDVGRKAIDQVIQVGAVPKYVAVTPDGATALVTNWCSWDLSVIDTASASVVATVKLGRYPRGVAVSPDSRTAYIAVMGANMVVTVDLPSAKAGGAQAKKLAAPGVGPRHILISTDGKHLFTSNNGAGTVTKIDAVTGAVVARVATGRQPRSMAMSADGSALYVVNYESSTMTKLASSDLRKLAEARTDHHPIGITYEPTKGRVWVACYGGSLLVFDDTGQAPRPQSADVAALAPSRMN